MKYLCLPPHLILTINFIIGDEVFMPPTTSCSSITSKLNKVLYLHTMDYLKSPYKDF